MRRNDRGWIIGLTIVVMVLSACATPQQQGPLVYNGRSGQIIEMVEKGQNVNLPDSNGLTPLMAAARSNNTDGIRILLKNGAHIQAKDRNGKTALAHAFETGSVDAFKVLLDSGAKVNFDMKSGGGHTLRDRMIQMVNERQLVEKIKARKTDVKMYDRYFSLFHHGVYRSEVASMLQALVNSEYKRVAGSNSLSEWKKFLDRYRHLGQHGYEITAKTLNIRKRDSLTSPKVGWYSQGQIVYGKAERYGWVLTDKGWISGTYTRPILQKIEVIEPYLRSAREKIRDINQTQQRKAASIKRQSTRVKPTTAPKPKKAPKPTVAETKPKPVQTTTAVPVSTPPASAQSQPSTEKTVVPATPEPADTVLETDSVESEFNQLMKSGTDSDLYIFIQRYKDDPEYAHLVRKARERYILLIRQK